MPCVSPVTNIIEIKTKNILQNQSMSLETNKRKEKESLKKRNNGCYAVSKELYAALAG